jgi:hypothetical protein
VPEVGFQQKKRVKKLDTVGVDKKTSTPNTSDRNTKTKTTNLNLALAQQKDGSMQWISEQIVGIGEYFHIQVDDGKVKTTLYKVRWSGYDRSSLVTLDLEEG